MANKTDKPDMIDPELSCNIINSAFKRPGLVRTADQIPITEQIMTGIWSFDTFVGGLPRGKITMIAGDEGTYKTSFVLHAMAHSSGRTLFVDAEQTFDPRWASKIGVDLSRVFVCRPESTEEAYDVISNYLDMEIDLDFIVIDSVAGLAAGEEIKKQSSEEARMGIRASLSNRFLRKINRYMSRDNAPGVILIQHVMASLNPYGGGFNIPCGKTQRYLSSLSIFLSREQAIKEDKRSVGWDIQWRLTKQKIPITFECGTFRFFTTNCTFDGVNYEQGELDNFPFLIKVLAELGIIERSGGWYKLGEERFHGTGQVREYVLQMVRENPEVLNTWSAMARERMAGKEIEPEGLPEMWEESE